MQNKSKFQFSFFSIALVLTLAFFAYPAVGKTESLPVHTGTVRVCSILANANGPLASADNSTPTGTFSLSVSTTKNFSSPVLTHNFNAQNFAHNTSINGIPMHCTDNVSVPFGEYYYNNISVIGDQAPWEQSKYFDGTEVFSLNLTSSYNNAFFTDDMSDDVLVNNNADGVVVVDETKPHRTIIVLNTFASVLNTDTTVTSCGADVNLVRNGGFEYPVVNNPLKWTSIPFSTSNLFWTSYDTVSYPYVEFQAGYTEGLTHWLPHGGIQYAEIDGGTDHDVSQVVTTIPGHVYKLSYWVSPRPNQSAHVNVMNVTVNGERIDTYSHAGSDMTQWSQRAYSFIATSTQTRISFTQGQNDYKGEGVFLDDVSLVCAGKTDVPPPANQCVIPDTLGDTSLEMIGVSYGHEATVAQILSGFGMTVNTATEQKQYQSFTLSPEATSTITVKYLEGDYSANGNVFGYYLNNDTSTFVPLFLSGVGANSAYASTTRVAEGYIFTLKVKASSIQFAIKSSASQTAPYTVSTVNTVNASQADRVLAFNTPGAQSHNDFILAFEDLPVSSSDNDYNDVVVQVVVAGCEKPNTPPTITLIGANPSTLTVGQPWNEPGATASDLEDGNITNKIVITGTVVTTTPGTYTLTYTVTDSGGLSASTTRQVIVSRQTPPPVNACVLVSNTTTQVLGGGDAVLAYVHPSWTIISGASWIWSTHEVIDANATTTAVFSKTFNATSTPTSAVLSISSDNSYIVKVNGVKVAENLGEFNYLSVATYNIASAITPGVNTITFEVTNFSQLHATPTSNPAGLIYKLELSGNGCGPVVTNTPPTITLIGANPSTLTVGQPWNEPGATASDLEDGNITNKIVITGTVVTTTPGTYTLTYTVTDSGGLSASTTRQVIVENGGGGGPTTGSITFCSIFTNKDNVIATSSIGLPFGSFAIKLATTTDIANSTIQSKTWSANTFAPNRKIILSQNDADCVTYSNLPFGQYYYSELGVSGSQWILSSTSPKYNDQFNAPVNNIFDLFAYSPELFTATTTDDSSRNVNADGLITLSADRREHTLVMVTKYADVPACMLPEFTSSTTVSGEVGKAFSFTLSATSTSGTITYSLATTSLPAGLSFTGNTISGTPTASGTFSVVGSAVNPCGTTTQTIVITIAPKQDVCTTCGGGTPPPVCTSNCGGGGGNGPIVTSLAITNEKVVEITPGVALVTWNTNLPATKEVGYGNTSQPASFIVAPFGYATSTVRVSSPLGLTHSYTIPITSGKTYYFRPVSTDGKTTVAGIELVLNPGTGNGGGNGTPNACYYLFDYLKQGWNNNPVEVKKLQVFLRDLEGFNVEITGVYDDQTVVALNAFQNRYEDDILTPWGHTAPTSFTYITTKKKVNEIYCKMAFPVTAQQQAEIDAFRAFLLGLTNAGVTLGTPTEEQLNQPVIVDTNEVGTLPIQNNSQGNTSATSTLGTLAGNEVRSTTTTAGRLTANVIESGKRLGNFAAAIFTWPWDWAKGWFGGNDDTQCTDQSVFSNWFNWILIIIIITMTYLWYRERKANKEALEINEELDLLNK